MEKTIYSDQYACFLSLIIAQRKQAGITQEQLAERLGETQSFVSKCERGERRLDIIEAWTFCQAMGLNFTAFIDTLEGELNQLSNG